MMTYALCIFGNGKIKIGSNILSCKRSIEREIKNFAKWQIQKNKNIF